MCGICGFAGDNSTAILQAMTDALTHRGPDEGGSHHHSGQRVHFGHRRLSIIDLTTGSQPIYNEDRSVAIVYNGELYNYRELRTELVSRGHVFTTTSDTEVLVHLYEQHGTDMFSRLNGIFAFAIHDQKQQRIILGRDQFGVKPLHYYHDRNFLIFSSEIKSLLLHPRVPRALEPANLHLFMNLRYIPGSGTLFTGIHRLSAGHYAVFDLAGSSLAIQSYVDRTRYPVDRSLSPTAAQDGIRHYLKQAVQRQLVSDVPVGVYLSGGMDSSALVAMMHSLKAPIKSFSIGFHEPTDEVSDARAVADHYHADHYDTFIAMNPLATLPQVIWHVEEPKVNTLQGYYLSGFARGQVKVALSGLGGDELFCGYTNYRILYPLQQLHHIMANIPGRDWLHDRFFDVCHRVSPLRLDLVRRSLQLAASYGDKTRFYLILRNAWDYNAAYYKMIYTPEFAEKVFSVKTRDSFQQYFSAADKSIVEQSLVAELNTKLTDDFLLNEDRTSMAHGVEVRVPFLDPDLVKFAFSIPSEYKIKHGITRQVYRQAMRGLLPDIVHRKRKWGFAINPYHQYQKDLRTVALRMLTEEKIKAQGIFNYQFIKQILAQPASPRLRWHYFHLWMLVGYQVWEQTFLNNRGAQPIDSIESLY